MININPITPPVIAGIGILVDTIKEIFKPFDKIIQQLTLWFDCWYNRRTNSTRETKLAIVSGITSWTQTSVVSEQVDAGCIIFTWIRNTCVDF